MKEYDQGAVPEPDARSGGGIPHPGHSVGRVSAASGTPVHDNVDAPFRPLVPFVPPEYWDRREATPQHRRSRIADRLRQAVAAVKRNYKARRWMATGR